MARHRDLEAPLARFWIGLLAGVVITGGGIFTAATLLQNEPTQAQDPTAERLADCARTTPVTAVVSEVMVALVSEAASRACVELDLTQANGRDGARASETTDLWVTDSSLWAAARQGVTPAPVSVASSPIVATARADLAQELGSTLDWPSLLSPDRRLRLGFLDPSSTATGLLGAWPFLQAQREVSDLPYTALALTAVTLANPVVVGSSVLADPPARMLLFSAEYAASPSRNVRILRGKQGEAYLDFPAYNLATDADTRAAVDKLIAVLGSTQVAEARSAARLRDADGEAGFDTTLVGDPSRRMSLPNEGSTIKLYGLGASGAIPGRVLVALDVSRSMGAIQTDGSTLFEQVRFTALVAMSALLDHTAVGVWLFGNDVDGTADHRELVPIAPLGENRQTIGDTVKTVRLAPGTTSALYPTVLAGYRALQRDFDPDSAQSLVILTSGRSDHRSGPSLDQVAAKLRQEADPDKPIRIMGVGFGPHADVSGLQRLSQEFGGTSARVKGPVQMLGLFITLVGQVAAGA